ncbi:hypothetical protein Bhyg_14728 [Pseudolycoriella hygida]|uniref:Uncharacterized protein n=1 Tax=Pseudolycoriella hygida TaxID=35572 RepID=A0A9Q0MQI3_9DIPT|nr:hypothetical protein Bhyg_14728 [Pseudolycoriella hygida]
MVTGEYQYFLEKLEDLRKEMNGISAGNTNANSIENSDHLPEVANTVTNRTAADLSVDVLDLSVPKAHSTAMGSYLAPAIVAENINSTIEDSSKTNTSDDASTLNDLPVNASIPQFTVVAASSSLAIREIILPSKRPSIGRPKGTSKNVIGTERKAEAKSSTTKMAKAKAKPSKDMVPTLRSKRVRKLKADALDMIDNKLLRLRKLRK